MQCSVCSSKGFTEAAHIQGRADFNSSQNDKIFNILPICPTCHYYFDTCKAFTINFDWKCWVFSDKRAYKSSQDRYFDNPFKDFYYAYPPKIHQRKMNNIEREQIETNQSTQFSVINEGSPKLYFQFVKDRLVKRERWDYQLQRPKMRILSSDLRAIDFD